ncbi:glucose-6-phosphate 1-epimerase [Pseudoscourfieldia marina]
MPAVMSARVASARPSARAPGRVSARQSSRCSPLSRSRVYASSETVTDDSLAALNIKYAIPGSVEFVEGREGLPAVKLTHACGASAEVYLFGGCVMSWKQATGDEVLYVRPDAKFDKSKPISGGMPHCFPQFGPGEMQQHGFARNLDWEVSSTSADVNPDDKDPCVEITLRDNEYTRAMWDHAFELHYSITLHGEELQTEYRVINTGDKPFSFQAALHSYFEVVNIKLAAVEGLGGMKYLDKVADAENPPTKEMPNGTLTFAGPVDSVFENSPSEVSLLVGNGAGIALQQTGFTDTIVWTPWEDMPDCYESFCCVENAKAVKPVTLDPNDTWNATTRFAVYTA